MGGGRCGERPGRSSSTASVGGRDNNAGFLNGGGGGYLRADDYADDVPRCTVDVGGVASASFTRRIPGAPPPSSFPHTHPTTHPRTSLRL